MYLQKNGVNLSQHHLEKCLQKAQTEENVNHAKENNLFCARKQNSSLEQLHNTADCNSFPPKNNALLITVLNTVLMCNNMFNQLKFKFKAPLWPHRK